VRWEVCNGALAPLAPHTRCGTGPPFGSQKPRQNRPLVPLGARSASPEAGRQLHDHVQWDRRLAVATLIASNAIVFSADPFGSQSAPLGNLGRAFIFAYGSGSIGGSDFGPIVKASGLPPPSVSAPKFARHRPGCGSVSLLSELYVSAVHIVVSRPTPTR
jgi:hypothetical protein